MGGGRGGKDEKKECLPFDHPTCTLFTPPSLPPSLPPHHLQVPDIEFADFVKAAKRAKSSVAPEELDHFTEWTNEFGQEG